MLFNYEVYGVALLHIIIGLVEIVKQFNILKKYMPIISIVIAEAISLLFLMNGDTDLSKSNTNKLTDGTSSGRITLWCEKLDPKT